MKEKLLAALNDKEIFKHVVNSPYKLKEVAGNFPQHAEAFVNIVLNDKEIFKHVVNSPYKLKEVAGNFPQHAEAFINIVLKQKEVFEHIIKDRYNLRDAAKTFPQYADIFGKSDVEAAAKAAETYALKMRNAAEIRKNARLLAQASGPNQNPNFFKFFPRELLKKIASFTGDPKVHNTKESEDIASKNFGRPKR